MVNIKIKPAMFIGFQIFVNHFSWHIRLLNFVTFLLNPRIRKEKIRKEKIKKGEHLLPKKKSEFEGL